jgi:hypothetical protein
VKNISTILAALATLVAIGGGLIGVPVWVQSVIAQESKAAAEEAVDERMDQKLAPTVLEMRAVKEAIREQLHFDMNEACMERKTRLRCEIEAQHRRATWLYDDCVVNEGGDETAMTRCAGVKPEPLPEE